MRVRIFFLTLLAIILVACGCTRAPQKTSEVPRILSHRYSIAVMPFTQPTTESECLAGHLPEHQGRIPEAQLMYLDVDLREMLAPKKEKRSITFASSAAAPKVNTLRYHSSSQPQALSRWAELARQSGKNFVLVPQVLDWQERAGSGAGVSEAARVQLVMYLVRADTGTIHSRAIFEEEQVGLADNLLTMKQFVQRRGAWVTARELAREGMATMLKELGL